MKEGIFLRGDKNNVIINKVNRLIVKNFLNRIYLSFFFGDDKRLGRDW